MKDNNLNSLSYSFITFDSENSIDSIMSMYILIS